MRRTGIIFVNHLLTQNDLCEHPGVPILGSHRSSPGSATVSVHSSAWLVFSSLDARLSLSFFLLSYLFSGPLSPPLPSAL